MSSSSASGSVRGWTPSTTINEEVDITSFSQFSMATTPSTLSNGFAPTPLVPVPSSSSNSRPTMHRHSLSLSLPVQPPQSHYRPPSHPSPTERRAQRKREDDPNWVPRPPNSFMIFRREFSREHARDNKDGEPVPEKHLSKRAGEAWALLSDAEQEVYKERAEQARREHARMFPNYRYRPRRRQGSTSQRRPPGGGPTRREQVESLMEEVGVGDHAADSDSESSPPASQESLRSSSLEPPHPPPRSETPVRSLRRRRSYSLPLRAPPSKSTYFLQPTACASTSGVDKRSRSAVTRPPSLSMSSGYFGMPLTPFNDPALDESVFQFSAFDSNSTAPSSPNTSLFDFSFEESFVSTSSVPSPKSFASQIPPNYSVTDIDLSVQSVHTVSPVQSISPGQSISSIQPIAPGQRTILPQDSNPLYHRRQRSNTTSVLSSSPLSAVTSSLANWNGEVSDTATSTSSLPIFAHSASSPDLLSSHYSSTSPYTTNPYVMQKQRHDFSQIPPQSGSLLVPSVDMDLDRTPKMSDFPRDVQNAYIAGDGGPVGRYDFTAFTMSDTAVQASQDLQSYETALEALRISPFDTPSIEHMYNRYINNPTPPPM